MLPLAGFPCAFTSGNVATSVPPSRVAASSRVRSMSFSRSLIRATISPSRIATHARYRKRSPFGPWT